MKNPLAIAAFAGVSVFAVAAAAYAIHARNSAINGWQAWATASAERQVAVATLEEKNASLSESAREFQRMLELKEAAVAALEEKNATFAASESEAVEELRGMREFQSMIILRDAGLPVSGPLDPHKANEAVRDFVYRSNVVGTGSFPFVRGDQRYAMLGRETGEQLCHGMALAQEWALTQVGVPARTVVLAGRDFLTGKDRFQTHAVVEVFLDGKWHISDPTFNISVNCSDGSKAISVPEAVECLRAGDHLIDVPGRTQIHGHGRTVTEYFTPYDTYFAAYERGPVSTPLVSAAKDEYPQPDWISKSLLLYPDPLKTAAEKE